MAFAILWSVPMKIQENNFVSVFNFVVFIDMWQVYGPHLHKSSGDFVWVFEFCVKSHVSGVTAKYYKTGQCANIQNPKQEWHFIIFFQFVDFCQLLYVYCSYFKKLLWKRNQCVYIVSNFRLLTIFTAGVNQTCISVLLVSQ